MAGAATYRVLLMAVFLISSGSLLVSWRAIEPSSTLHHANVAGPDAPLSSSSPALPAPVFNDILEKKLPAGPPSCLPRHLLATSSPPNTITEPFQIFVLAYIRVHSLSRLLHSLEAAEYNEDSVSLTVFVDADARPSRNGHLEVASFARSFPWSHGEYTVVVREENRGIVRQWIEAWQPERDGERAIILEDDNEVSPMWYRHLLLLYSSYEYTSNIAGFALCSQRVIGSPSRGGPKVMSVTPRGTPFLYRLFATTGFVPLARHWSEFQTWFASRPRGFRPLVRGSVYSSMYESLEKEKREGTMWSMWFIRFCFDRGLFTLYPNLEQSLGALVVFYAEKGLHHSGTTPGPNAKLAPLYTPLPFMFPKVLTRYNWDGTKEGTVNTLSERLSSAALCLSNSHPNLTPTVDLILCRAAQPCDEKPAHHNPLAFIVQQPTSSGALDWKFEENQMTVSLSPSTHDTTPNPTHTLFSVAVDLLSEVDIHISLQTNQCGATFPTETEEPALQEEARNPTSKSMSTTTKKNKKKPNLFVWKETEDESGLCIIARKHSYAGRELLTHLISRLFGKLREGEAMRTRDQTESDRLEQAVADILRSTKLERLQPSIRTTRIRGIEPS